MRYLVRLKPSARTAHKFDQTTGRVKGRLLRPVCVLAPSCAWAGALRVGRALLLQSPQCQAFRRARAGPSNGPSAHASHIAMSPTVAALQLPLQGGAACRRLEASRSSAAGARLQPTQGSRPRQRRRATLVTTAIFDLPLNWCAALLCQLCIRSTCAHLVRGFEGLRKPPRRLPALPTAGGASLSRCPPFKCPPCRNHTDWLKVPRGQTQVTLYPWMAALQRRECMRRWLQREVGGPRSLVPLCTARPLCQR